MEDKFTNQEEQLRALTEDFSLTIDASELWSNIEGQLPPLQKGRRRPLFWWFAGSILIIIFGLLGLYNYSMTPETDLIAEKSNLAPFEAEGKEPEDAYQEYTDNSSKDVSNSIQLKSEQTIINHTSKDKVISKTTISNSKITKQINLSVFNSSRYVEKPKAWIEEKAINHKSDVQFLNVAVINPYTSNIDGGEVDLKNPARTYTTAIFLNPSPLKLLKHNFDYEFLDLGIKPIKINVKHEFPAVEIKPIRIKQWLPFYAFTSGVNMHGDKIYSNSDEGLDLNQFEKEKSMLGISSNLHFGFENNNGWRFGIGLAHHRLVSRFTQQESVTTSSDIIGTSSSKIDDDGNIINLTGTLIQSTVTHYNIIWHRNHDFLNAQLSVGKQIFQKGKFAFYSDVNLSKNIWSKHAGYYFTEDNSTITKFSNGEDHPYSNAGFYAGLNMDLEYKINEFSICLKPYAQIGLNSITQNSNYYQLKNSLYGVQLGVVYRP